MFNLLTVMFAIVLVLVLAVAGVYYAGDLFAQKAQETVYTEYTNKASQVKAAMEIYKSRNGVYPTAGTTNDLFTLLVNDGYLAGKPEGDWDLVNMVLMRPITDAATCAKMNEMGGYDTSLVADGSGCPSCADGAFKMWPACQN